MRLFKPLLMLTLLMALFAAQPTEATLVKQLNLGEMTSNADKIFRGTVVKVESGTIQAGGGDLPTVKYVIRVIDTLKGDISASSQKDSDLIELTMLGNIKAPSAKNGIRFVGGFKTPLLQTGKEYLLFTTAPSNAGLSMTVGVGQGLFNFVYGEQVINEAKNAGLFRDMDRQGMPQRGAIPYSDIAQRVKGLISDRGEE